MANTSTVSLTLAIAGAGLATSWSPAAFPTSNPIAPEGFPVNIALQAGDNPIAVPSGTIGCFIQAPIGSVNVKTVSNTTGTVGANFVSFHMSDIPSGVTTLHVNAVAGESVQVAFF